MPLSLRWSDREDMKKRAHVFISGRVQGVFFRNFTEQSAVERGVSGWVRNLADGRVEAVLEGDERSVNRVLEALRTGPPHSKVDSLDVQTEKYTGELRGFEIKYF